MATILTLSYILIVPRAVDIVLKINSEARGEIIRHSKSLFVLLYNEAVNKRQGK
jgi:hypothetical protein